MDQAKHSTREVRIMRKYPGITCGRIWKNLYASMVPDMKNLYASIVPDMKNSTWFEAIHNIMPTKDRLAAIHLTKSSSCARCGEPDSIHHTITESNGDGSFGYGHGQNWGSHFVWIPGTCYPIGRPAFQYWLLQSHPAP